MAQFRKRPVVIDAFRLGEEWPDWWADAVSARIVDTFNEDGRWRGGPDYALIKTLEGVMRANFGDWIIRGVEGEIYPCKPAIFAATYEAVEATDKFRRSEALRAIASVRAKVDARAELLIDQIPGLRELVESASAYRDQERLLIAARAEIGRFPPNLTMAKVRAIN